MKAPSHKYGGKLEGLCGNCNKEPADDLIDPSGTPIEDLNEFALSWLYDKLPGGQSKENCGNKPEEQCPPLPEDSDPCNQIILDYKTFGQCLRILEPSVFLEWCKKDTCNNHPELACTSIEAYARECSSAGFCVNWRNEMCKPKTCPPDQIYNPCGPKCPKTCKNIKAEAEKCPNIPVEGCFCPEGKVFLNDTCVLEKDCEVCDEEGHHPGDQWKKDKCTTCTCKGTSLECETQHCSEGDKICEVGYQPIKIPTKEEQCCDKYACLPEPTAGPTCEAPQKLICGPGQILKLETKPNGCQQFLCQCKAKEDCDQIFKSELLLEDGMVEEIDESGCCPEVKLVCKTDLCPKPKECPQYHTLKNERSSKCCPLYTCEAPQDQCIFEPEYKSAEQGGERPINKFEKLKLLKNANETWKDGPCRECQCLISPIGNYVSKCTKKECQEIDKHPDLEEYELEEEFVYDQCCPKVKRVGCKFDQKIYTKGEKWIKGDYCVTYECVGTETGVQKEKKVTDCDKNCDSGFKYIPPEAGLEQCCGSCKAYACVVDGSLYEVGQEWESQDHCTKFTCVNVNGTVSYLFISV